MILVKISSNMTPYWFDALKGTLVLAFISNFIIYGHCS